MIAALPLVLFVVLLGWGLYDNDLYPGEAGIYAGVFAVVALGSWLLKLSPAIPLVALILIDIILVIKLLGGDTQAF